MAMNMIAIAVPRSVLSGGEDGPAAGGHQQDWEIAHPEESAIGKILVKSQQAGDYFDSLPDTQISIRALSDAVGDPSTVFLGVVQCVLRQPPASRGACQIGVVLHGRCAMVWPATLSEITLTFANATVKFRRLLGGGTDAATPTVVSVRKPA